MPRVSNRHYLKAHQRLKRYWLHQNMSYGYLSSEEQWQLHDYFQPSHAWSDAQLLEHRKQITRERPNLPHQAGRALAKIDEIAPQVALHRVRTAKRTHVGKRTNTRTKDTQIRLLAVVKPEIDNEKLARPLVVFILEQERRARESSDDVTAA